MDWGDVFDRVGEAAGRAIDAINRGLLMIFGNSNERVVRKMLSRVAAINALEAKMEALSGDELRAISGHFRERLARGETLNQLLPEAFAACREAGRRYLKMRHYDVQLLGGMVLHNGQIAEMVTGEGKTLVATLAVYLNALEGRGMHVVTVNDYLARRDAEWMSPLYNGLGLSVGAIQSNMDSIERQHHYNCDITYGTNNEFGFDYLRDNMKLSRESQCQRELRYAIIDEVDSILIDEARTPLIISGQAFDDPGKYRKAHQVAMQLRRDTHFEVKEKEHSCHLTDAGVLEAERLVGVESFYTAGNMQWPHLIDNALKAIHLYRRDKEYMVRNGEVIIIDEHTGRAMEGRQWSDGLHQSVEAKENVTIKDETQTLATITFQNFFKLYHKIAGMTGTAMTEAHEFYKIYKLDVVAIPTNRALIRENSPDVIFCTQKEKWNAIVEEVKLVHRTGRPILIGTTSVENSEFLSKIFERHGIKHEMLNAKFVEREAEIIAQAGRRGAVTISTNMAGRGTDIILGGNPEIQAWAELRNAYPTRLEVPAEVWRDTVAPYEEPMRKEGREIAQPTPTLQLAKSIKRLKQSELLAKIIDEATPRELQDVSALARKHNINDLEPELFELSQLWRAARPGGLHVVGTERHESRRIDNQLRGRAGRQGDPGSSRFFLSLEDDLMRIFLGDWVRTLLQRMGMKDGEAIESKMVSRRIEGAQRKVEERNFEIRKNLLEYDEIMDTQRKRVYSYRQRILEGGDCKQFILQMIDKQIDHSVKNYLAKGYGPKAFCAWASHRMSVEFDPRDFLRCDFETAVAVAKENARQQAEMAILDKIEEDLSNDIEDKRQWNWEALTNWVNSRWHLGFKSYDLKQKDRDKLYDFLSEKVRKVVDDVNLESGKDFFDPAYGVKALLTHVNQKFCLSIYQDEMVETSPGEFDAAAEFLKKKARDYYERRDVEFPVHCGMMRYMPEKSNRGGTPRVDREGLAAWANSRFGANLTLDEIQFLSRQQVQERLWKASDLYLQQRPKDDEIKRRIQEVFGAKKAVSVEELEPLLSWLEPITQMDIELTKPLIERQEVEAFTQSMIDDRFRSEMATVERTHLLGMLDNGWKDHLYAMDHLRSGIGLVGYAQVDPKVEYKRKGRQLFEEMWESVENRVTDVIFRAEEIDPNFVSNVWNITNAVHETYRPQAQSTTNSGGQSGPEPGQTEQVTAPIRNQGQKLGRNDPCWCGSGKKYKNCHMKTDPVEKARA